MINLMNENSLVELEIEKDGSTIRLKKANSEQATPIIYEHKQQVMPNSPMPLDAGQTSAAKPIPKGIEIKAPMVGTFYRAPSPDSPPYIDVGQIVEPGQVICIIEAMKLMNEIKSEIKGKVLEVLSENTEPVEFGQSLFLIEPL